MHSKSFTKILLLVVVNKIIAYKDTNKKYLFTNVITLKKNTFQGAIFYSSISFVSSSKLFFCSFDATLF